jgi:hypothetical protein
MKKNLKGTETISDALNERLRLIDKALIEDNGNRATGRTTKLVDAYIQKFFHEPKNTPIFISDHYDNRYSHYMLLKRICKRLDTEFSGVSYKSNYANNSIMRMAPTPKERLEDERVDILNKLKEIGTESK